MNMLVGEDKCVYLQIAKEYVNRIRKIWNSQLSDFNKAVAHNTFAVPTLTYAMEILEQTCKEKEQIDIKTRKTVAMSGSFHLNSDTDRLYFCKKDGRRYKRYKKNALQQNNIHTPTLKEYQRHK